MRTVQHLAIAALRGLRGVELVGCGSFNLLLGANNSGKTTVLEALHLLGDPTSPTRWREVPRLRRTAPLLEPWGAGAAAGLEELLWLFPGGPQAVADGDAERCAIRVHSEGALGGMTVAAERRVAMPPQRAVSTPGLRVEAPPAWVSRATRGDGPSGGPQLNLELTIRRDGESDETRLVLWDGGALRERRAPRRPGVRVISALEHRADGRLAELFRGAFEKGAQADLVAILQRFDPRIVDIATLVVEAEAGVPRPRVSVVLRVDGLGLVPLHALGDGTRRALTLALHLAVADPGDVLLIDEVELGLHVNVLRSIVPWLMEMAGRVGAQIFATCHSLEVVDAALNTQGAADGLVVYRLGPRRVARYDHEEARFSRAELGLELR
jgi:energy-coupling factor transporter ATP-binding protein EcfA2